jgi:hypothetical protein
VGMRMYRATHPDQQLKYIQRYSHLSCASSAGKLWPKRTGSRKSKSPSFGVFRGLGMPTLLSHARQDGGCSLSCREPHVDPRYVLTAASHGFWPWLTLDPA